MTISSAEELTPLSDHELWVLRQVGQHWASVVGGGGERTRRALRPHPGIVITSVPVHLTR